MSELLGLIIPLTRGLAEALPFITSIVRADPAATARSIIDEARAAGLQFRDTGAFNLIAQIKANITAEELFKVGEFDELPSAEAIGRSLDPLTKDYSFLVSIKGLNQTTGARERRYVTIVSDNLLTPQQILETALSLPSGREGSQILTNSTITIESALKSKYVR